MAHEGRGPFEVHVPGLFWALVSDAINNVSLEIEFTARHMEPIRQRFAQEWQSLDRVPGHENARLQYGSLADGHVLWVVVAEQIDITTVELASFRLLGDIDPDYL